MAIDQAPRDVYTLKVMPSPPLRVQTLFILFSLSIISSCASSRDRATSVATLVPTNPFDSFQQFTATDIVAITAQLVEQLNVFLVARSDRPITVLVGDFRNSTDELLQLNALREELEITLIAHAPLVEWIEPSAWLTFRQATSLGGYERRQFMRTNDRNNLPFEFILFGDIQVNSSVPPSDRKYIIRLYLTTPAVRGETLTAAEIIYSRA